MCPAESKQPAPQGPLVWALIGPKHGDNAQVRTLAGVLARRAGARVREQLCRYHAAELLVHLWPGASLAGLDPRVRPPLAAPWPDLVIGAGRRSEPVARWIRRQSGGRTRIVHLGRPWAAPDAFDLIVSSSQYFVPGSSRVLECRLPLTGPGDVDPGDAGSTAAESQAISVLDAVPDAVAPPPFAGLPRPWTGVLLGGDSGYLLFDHARARELAARLNDSRTATGGSLLVTGSPRTPAAFLDALRATLDTPGFFHRWSAEAPNPYRGILAVADTLIVTSDSVSMVVEAIATGKPVYLFDVRPRGPGWWLHAGEYRWRALSHRFVQAVAPRRFRRDIRRIHQRLVEAGAVRWLEGPARPFRPVPVDPDGDLEAALGRVLALLGERRSGSG